ncbi:MAG: DUF1080 domain-containing protein [Planctomycetaceae bacterium]
MLHRVTYLTSIFIALAVTGSATAQLKTGWRAHDLKRPAAPVVNPGKSTLPTGVPSDAIVLFDGKDLSKWRNAQGKDAGWKIVDGAMESVAGSGYVYSREEFGDCQLHVEWASPATVKGNGQGRGNSGVFLMGDYEVQVLDSFENPTYVDGSAGSIYGQYPPLVNVSRKPGEWQSYDIVFTAPRFEEDGKLKSAARITVLHNGVVIQANSEIIGPTAWIVHEEYKKKTKGPIGLQDHGNPVRYRNIWVRPLKPRARPETPYPAETKLDADQAKLLVGDYSGNKVMMKDGLLYFRFKNRPKPLEMVPQENGEFGFRKSAGRLKFELNDDGKPAAIDFTLDATGNRKAKRNEDIEPKPAEEKKQPNDA